MRATHTRPRRAPLPAHASGRRRAARPRRRRGSLASGRGTTRRRARPARCSMLTKIGRRAYFALDGDDAARKQARRSAPPPPAPQQLRASRAAALQDDRARLHSWSSATQTPRPVAPAEPSSALRCKSILDAGIVRGGPATTRTRRWASCGRPPERALLQRERRRPRAGASDPRPRPPDLRRQKTSGGPPAAPAIGKGGRHTVSPRRFLRASMARDPGGALPLFRDWSGLDPPQATVIQPPGRDGNSLRVHAGRRDRLRRHKFTEVVADPSARSCLPGVHRRRRRHDPAACGANDAADGRRQRRAARPVGAA